MEYLRTKFNLIFLLPLPFCISYFYWGKGLLKSNQSDLALGLLLLILSCMFSFIAIRNSGAFSFASGFLILFGALTLLLVKKYVETPGMFFNKIRLKSYGALAIVLGLVFFIVM